MIHRIVIDWDDRRGMQRYRYKAYDCRMELVEEGNVSDSLPIPHSASDEQLISALVWVGFNLDTAIHRHDCIVEKGDKFSSPYAVWDKKYQDGHRSHYVQPDLLARSVDAVLLASHVGNTRKEE